MEAVQNGKWWEQETAYHYLEPLSDGGGLYLVRQTASGKIMTARLAEESQRPVYERLQRLCLPHQARIAEIRETPCIVYAQYLEGQSLRQMLKARGVLSAGEAIAYMLQLCDALEAVHGAGIVHRDIKPENIIIGEKNCLYLIDFDIARIVKETAGRDTRLLGTEGYAAPEQFGFRQSDARTDLYGAGVLYNEMLTGCFPNERLADGAAGEIIRRCISMEPESRFANAERLKQALLEAERQMAQSVEREEEWEAGARSGVHRVKPDQGIERAAEREAFARMGVQRTRTAGQELVLRSVAQRNTGQGKGRQKFTSSVPGFRTGHLGKMVVATLFYFYSSVFFGVRIEMALVGQQDPIVILCLLFWYVVTFLFVFDCFGFRRLFLPKTGGKLTKRYAVSAFLWEIVFTCICLAVLTLLKMALAP